MLDKNWMLPYFCGVVGCLSKWPQSRKKNMIESNDRKKVGWKQDKKDNTVKPQHKKNCELHDC